MIFVTVGAQMSFPRLIDAVDRWALKSDRRDVVAQIGPSADPPEFIRWSRFLAPMQFTEMMNECELVIGHAGIGTIIGALMARKPLIVMPRRGDLNETRNDHQIATARRFAADRDITVAMDEEELTEILDRAEQICVPSSIGSHASIELISAIRRFAYEGTTAGRSVQFQDVQTAPQLGVHPVAAK